MSTVKPISKERFEALSYARSPHINNIAVEIEWFSSESGAVLGVVLHDQVDFDFSFLVLGRDKRGIFRCIDLGVSLETKKSARQKMLISVNTHQGSGNDEFPQGDELTKKNLLLKPIVADDKLHSYFRTLLLNPGYSCAKELITEIAYAFIDPDKNYIQQFQTTGFNSRLWELFLFAYFHEEKFEINREHTAPDFHLFKYGTSIFVEAVTLNPGDKMPSPPNSKDEIFDLLKDFMPIRYSNALCSKLNRARDNKVNYWDLKHVKGKPFILAVHDFTYDNSMTWSRSAIETYLYGYRHLPTKDVDGTISVKAEKVDKHIWEGKEVNSGFFNFPDSENISAVLFANSGTLTKFNRMGFLAGFGSPDVYMVRNGWLFDHRSGRRDNFEVEVIKGKYTETWAEGVTLYHNPKAKYPINENLFPHLNHITAEQGDLGGIFQDYFPVESTTSILMKKK